MEGRLEWRKREFMQGVDFESVRKQREDFSIEIRRQNRLEQAAKRRLLSQDSPSDLDPSIPHEWLPSELLAAFPDLSTCTTNYARLRFLKDTLASQNDRIIVQRILKAIRSSTCSGNPKPVDELVSLGFLQGLKVMAVSDDSNIASEATWIISNIAADTKTNTTAVVESGAMDVTIELLTSPNLDVQEHSIWTLGNIAGDCYQFRDLLLQRHVHTLLIRFLTTLSLEYHAKCLRVSAWTLCNLVRGKPPVMISVATDVLDAIRTPFRLKDKELKLNLMYILESLSSAGNDFCEQIISRDFLPKILRSVRSKRKKIATSALKIVGSIASGAENLTQLLLNNNALDTLLHIIPSTDTVLRCDSLWILGNFAAGSRSQLSQLLNHSIIHIALKALTDLSERVRLEASYIVYNTVRVGHSEHVRKLVSLGVCAYLRSALKERRPEYLFNVLTMVESILAIGDIDARELDDGLNPQVAALDSYDCIEPLQSLCSHDNDKVRKKAEFIISRYFDHMVSQEVEMTEPPAQFSFS